jgi:hypothetical protein
MKARANGSVGASLHGNRSVRTVLVQAAACEYVDPEASFWERYRRLKKRRGSKRAALAVGHSILVIYVSVDARQESLITRKEKSFSVRRISIRSNIVSSGV